MVYSVLRTPGGIEVLAEEDGWAPIGAHDADVGSMFNLINCGGWFGPQSGGNFSSGPWSLESRRRGTLSGPRLPMRNLAGTRHLGG
jgi:hypothetical protein